jgi:hypothetical protein
MNKFRKHITKKRKLLNKRKRIHRRTVKKTKGGFDLYKSLIGLLIVANATQAFQNKPNISRGLQTSSYSTNITPRLDTSTNRGRKPPRPPHKPPLRYKSDDYAEEPPLPTDEELEKIAEENIGNKIKQDAVETYVTAKTKELLGEGANTLFAQPVEEIILDIKKGKSNPDAEKLINAVRQQIG